MNIAKAYFAILPDFTVRKLSNTLEEEAGVEAKALGAILMGDVEGVLELKESIEDALINDSI